LTNEKGAEHMIENGYIKYIEYPKLEIAEMKYKAKK